MAAALSLAKIEEMFAAYAEKPSPGHVSAVSGVSPKTVQKYINDGDPVRGIEPFAQRMKRITRMAARRVEKKISYRKADAQAAAWEHLSLLDDCIVEALLHLRENMSKTKPKLHEIAKAVSISTQLKTQLKQWAEDDQDAQNPEDFFDGWTEKEMDDFIEFGTMPSQDKLNERQEQRESPSEGHRDEQGQKGATVPPGTKDQREGPMRPEKDANTPEDDFTADELYDPKAKPIDTIGSPDANGPEIDQEDEPEEERKNMSEGGRQGAGRGVGRGALPFPDPSPDPPSIPRPSELAHPPSEDPALANYPESLETGAEDAGDPVPDWLEAEE
jgi:hypothetical protein